jgi:CheY-like chemotaxis protein/signal transduction histidine kinase
MKSLDRLISDGGEVAEQLAQVRWNTTDVGDPASWSPTLYNAVTQCLATPTPTQVWWGPSLTLIYNDAAISMIEQHPIALGRNVPEVECERWRTIRTEVERVMETGIPETIGDLRLVPLLETDGSVGGILCAHAVVADAREAGKRQRDGFAAMVGHELRNPLSTLSTMLQALLMRSPSEEFALMQRAVHRMTVLVEDLLDTSRLSRGKAALQRRVVELAPIIDRAREIAAPLTAGRISRMLVDVPRVSWRVDADAERLARAIANVLEVIGTQHATCDRPIDVMIEVERDGGHIHLFVRDRDPGAGERPDPVIGPRPAPTRGGLGLELARDIVELHGGLLAVHRATEERGMECVIQLVSASAPAVEYRASETEPRRRLLLVEDDNDSAQALKGALEALGYEVALAHDGPIAINLARTFRPDVALLDLGLPIMDGWELAERLRATSGSLPIVAITAWDEDADKQRSAEAGFIEHIVKPIDLSRLEQLVDTLPRRHRGSERRDGTPSRDEPR